MSSESKQHSCGAPSAASEKQDIWDRRYSEHDWPSQPDPALVTLVSPLRPGRALDLGCGPGRNAVWLAQQGWEVTGVDSSAVGLAQAVQRAQAQALHLTTVHSDLLTYEFAPEYYDLVVIANIHLPLVQRDELFTHAAAALEMGGHVFLIGHHLDSLGRAGPPDPSILYTEESLRGAFPTLHIEQLDRLEREQPEGQDPLIDVVLWAVRTLEAIEGENPTAAH